MQDSQSKTETPAAVSSTPLFGAPPCPHSRNDFSALDVPSAAADEEIAWQWFAEAHPHEAYSTWPERFWAFFQQKCPGISRERMEHIIRETDMPNERVER